MRSVILTLTLAVAALMAGAHELYQHVPQPVATSVIGEKAEKTMGGQMVQVLPATMTEKQHKLLNMAYEVGKANGFKNPELIQAILLQESQAGAASSYKVANPGPDAYFGAMQIKLAAAKDVLMRWPSLFTAFAFHTRSDDEIKANLILNDRFNLEVATKYLLILKQTYGFTGRELVNAYNRGPGGVKDVDHETYHYAVSAEQKLETWKQRQR